MKTSAGIVLYRFKNRKPEVLLVHPGGPFWKNKDAGAWSIPKGEFGEGEDPLQTAKKEFREETGQSIDGDFIQLQPIKQKGGKIVHAWAIEGDIDEENIESNTFEMEWPPNTGKKIVVPEVDKAGWFTLDNAKEKINTAQANLLQQLEEKILNVRH